MSLGLEERERLQGGNFQMTDDFFERPILNSPYDYPAGHWELDPDGQPTNKVLDSRRRSELITPVPNAVRHANSKLYSRGFLIVTPGITIRDRLRVILPSDPDSYYRTREIVPPDMLDDIGKAKIVITNYHDDR
jgi:hypothetical protein